MARIEDLLREEFGEAGARPGPDRDAMLARVARVRRVRAAGAAAGCLVIAVSLALVAVYTVRPRGTGVQLAGPPPARQYTASVINTLFTDQGHGYVVQERCATDQIGNVPDGAPTPDIHQDCTTRLLVTSDGGHTWQERALPGDPATKDAGVDLVSGHSVMLWETDNRQLALGGWDQRY